MEMYIAFLALHVLVVAACFVCWVGSVQVPKPYGAAVFFNVFIGVSGSGAARSKGESPKAVCGFDPAGLFGFFEGRPAMAVLSDFGSSVVVRIVANSGAEFVVTLEEAEAERDCTAGEEPAVFAAVVRYDPASPAVLGALRSIVRLGMVGCPLGPGNSVADQQEYPAGLIDVRTARALVPLVIGVDVLEKSVPRCGLLGFFLMGEKRARKPVAVGFVAYRFSFRVAVKAVGLPGFAGRPALVHSGC